MPAIDAVIWRGVYNRLRTARPQEGLEVIATGE